jgi:hypothetical protein
MRQRRALMPNSGRCDLVYLCAGPDATDGHSHRQFILAVSMANAPTMRALGRFCKCKCMHPELPVM